VTLAAEEIKACCATAYSSAAARFLLGDSFHPGGAALTARLGGALGVGPGDVVADVACGPGTSAYQLARETGCDVVGVDLSPDNVAAARVAAEKAGLAERVRFMVGDAESLPLDDASVEGALCECALCTFPDKDAAAGEVARVLGRGAHLVLADVTADPARLPVRLRTPAAWIACIADARPLDETARLLDRHGLVVERLERHDAELTILLERVEARLAVLRISGLASAEAVATAAGVVASARDAVTDGVLGYGVLVARKQ
jgi:SAM-dependent methyltransferase